MSNYAVESTKVPAPDNVSLHTSGTGRLSGVVGGKSKWVGRERVQGGDFRHERHRKSTGRPSLTGFAEVNDVVAVCDWVCENAGVERILLVGSSAVDQIERVVGYINLVYPFGLISSVLFGRHHKAILESSKPKLFIMGTRDGFTSVKQLKNMLSSAVGRVEMHLIEVAGHFQMKGPDYFTQMVNLILDFSSSL